MVKFAPKVLTIDLADRSAAYGIFTNLGSTLGGLGLALALLAQSRPEHPTVFAVGPLNGLFPFASKVCLLSLGSEGLRESYLSGRLSVVLPFAKIDAVVIKGVCQTPTLLEIGTGGQVEFLDPKERTLASLGLAGRRSVLSFIDTGGLADGYFQIPKSFAQKFYLANLWGLSVTGEGSQAIAKDREYRELYQEILSRGRELEVSYAGFPSCAACPAGCEFSQFEEARPELLLSHCLVTCGFARKIYEDIPTAFACLDCLGLAFGHEDLEALPERLKYLRLQFAS